MEAFKAVRIGLILIISSALIFMSAGISFGIYGLVKLNLHPSFMILLLILSLIFYAPFWSFILVKWQIWSLNKIYDFETFIELAQKRALIYPQEHFYSKYAIALKKDKDLLKELILKGENSNRLEILREKYQFKTVLFYKKLSRLFNTLPILELSIEGVLLNGKGVINWTDFQYIEPKTSGGKYPDFWIEYQLKKTNKIEIYKLTNLKGGLLRLEYFFKLYKQLATTINIRNAGRCAKFEP